MNRENIKKLIEHLTLIRDEQSDEVMIKYPVQHIIETSNVILSARPSADNFGFNMSTWVGHHGRDMSGHGCQTVGCIAGHTVALFWDEAQKLLADDDSKGNSTNLARQILGLTNRMADDLFLVNDQDGWAAETNVYGYSADSLSGVSLDHAVQTLELLLETGRVSWHETFPDARPCAAKFEGYI